MITESQVESALFFLRDSAPVYGKARGHERYCDANLRRVKSLQMMGKEGSAAMLEAQAYASDEYKSAVEALRDATEQVETLRAQRDASEFAIEVWRSQSSARKQGINV